MLDQILPADIDDEGDLGLQRRDIREVLLGAHANISACGPGPRFQSGNNRLQRNFIREKVFELKVPIWLGKIAHQLPEFRVADLRRQVVRGAETHWRDKNESEQQN